MTSFILLQLKKSGSSSPVKMEFIEYLQTSLQDLGFMYITDPRNFTIYGYVHQNKIDLNNLITDIKKHKGYNSVVQNIFYTDTLKKR